MTYGIVAAVGKHVIAKQALASRRKCVGVEEAADLGVVIPGLQVIEAGISDRILAKTPFGSLGDSKMLSPQRSNYIGKVLCLFRNVSCRVPIPRWVFFVHIR